jgi:DNA-3-methyladenine glycosylase I
MGGSRPDDRLLFEFLVLEGAQAGLRWLTVLRKRPHYHQAFHNFDPGVIAGFGEDKIAELMANPGLIRSRRKI